MAKTILFYFRHGSVLNKTLKHSKIFKNNFWATVCKTVRPMLSVRCPVLSCLSVTFVHCGQTVGRIKTKLGVQVGLGPGHIVLDGDPSPPPPKWHNPPFSAHICCGQMAAWIKTSLGMELGLGQSNFVLDGDHAPRPQKGGSPQIFGPYLLRPNGWIDEAGTWHGSRPQPRRLCVRWEPRSTSPKGGRNTQIFAHVYGGQTAG